MSLATVKMLLVFYFVIMGETIFERKWWWALYWFGAFILNLAVMKAMEAK